MEATFPGGGGEGNMTRREETVYILGSAAKELKV